MGTRTNLLAVVAAFITYGSLYPFDFGAPGDVGAAFEDLLFNVSLWTSRGDVLGNVGLFVPFGLAGVWWIGSASARRRAAAVTAVAGLLLALGLQVAQIWVPSREAVLADVFWNGIGVFAGIGAGLVLGLTAARARVRMDATRSAATALVGLWFVGTLAPLVPALDFEGLKRSLKPLLLTPSFDWVAIIYVAAQVLLLARVLSAVAGPGRAFGLTVAALAVALAGKLVIIEQVLDWSTVAGMTAGAAASFIFGRPGARFLSAAPLLAVVVAAYTLQSLAPFAMGNPSTFHWVPFASVLQGSMLSNLRALSTVGFALGGSVWLMRELGWRVLPAAAVLATWVLALEFGQIWIEGRTASSTEPCLALVAGWLLARVVPDAAAGR